MNPIWSRELEEMTCNSCESLTKCSNIILSNYNNLKIGNINLVVDQSFRPHLVPYEHIHQEPRDYQNDLVSTSCIAINNTERIECNDHSLSHNSMQNVKQNNSLYENRHNRSISDRSYIDHTHRNDTSRCRSVYSGIEHVNLSENEVNTDKINKYSNSDAIAEYGKSSSKSSLVMQQNFQMEYDDILYSSKELKEVRRSKRSEYMANSKSFERNLSSTISYQKVQQRNDSSNKFNNSSNISRRSRSPGFEDIYLKFANNKRDSSFKDIAICNINKKERLPPKHSNTRKSTRNIEITTSNLINSELNQRNTQKYNACFNKTAKVMPDSMCINVQPKRGSIAVNNMSPKSTPFACISNQNLRSNANKRNQTDEFCCGPSQSQYISNRENKSRKLGYKSNLNDCSLSPSVIVIERENQYSSSTNYEEESDTMESIDEALPQKLAIHQTKMTRTLCEFKNNHKIIKRPVNVQSNIHLNIDAKERSHSPVLQFDEETDSHL